MKNILVKKDTIKNCTNIPDKPTKPKLIALLGKILNEKL